MPTPLERHAVLSKRLRTAQIVIGMLVLGVLLFAAVLLVLGATGWEPPVSEPGPLPLSWILAFVAVVQAPVFLILRTALLGRARQGIAAGTWPMAAADPDLREAGDAGRLFQAWFHATIVLCAGLEAAALMCLVAFLIEGQSWTLALGGAFGLALAMQMPSREGMDRRLGAELEAVERLRAT